MAEVTDLINVALPAWLSNLLFHPFIRALTLWMTFSKVAFLFWPSQRGVPRYYSAGVIGFILRVLHIHRLRRGGIYHGRTLDLS